MWRALTGAETSFIYKVTHPLLVACNCSALFHKCLRRGGTGGRGCQRRTTAEVAPSDVLSHHDVLLHSLQCTFNNQTSHHLCCSITRLSLIIARWVLLPCITLIVYDPKVCILATMWSAAVICLLWNEQCNRRVLLLLLVLLPAPYPQDQFNRCHLCSSFPILSSEASVRTVDCSNLHISRQQSEPVRWSEFTAWGENRKTHKRDPEVVKTAVPRVSLDVWEQTNALKLNCSIITFGCSPVRLSF